MKIPPTLVFTFLAVANASQAQLLLTEVQSNQASGSTSGDFWELTNTGTSPVDISGYRWTDFTGGNSFSNANPVPSGTTIAAGESIILTNANTESGFRTWWGSSLAPGVKVIASGGEPGLGMNDGITFYNSAGGTVFGFSYAASGFTRSNGSGAAGGHAGASGGSTATTSLVWDPTFGTSTPRYTAAVVGTNGGFAAAGSATEVGSPGVSGFGSAAPSITLTLGAVPSSFSESAANPAATGTVTRDGSTTSSLLVNLVSNDTTEATVPATVTIPANQASATFPITAVNDNSPDGNQSVTLTATAADASAGTTNLTVQDDGDTIATDLRLTEIQSNQASPAAGTEDYWELTNFGDTAVSLAGYTWHDSGRSYAAAQAWALAPGSSIAPGESVIFTVAAPTDFRAWWGIPASVQVFQTPGAPGLGGDDGVSFFNSSGFELFYVSYGPGGVTRTGNTPSIGGHAGLSAGGSLATQALIYDPRSLDGAPRFTFASGATFGTIQATGGAADFGSPGKIDKLVDLSTYVRVGRYDLPEPTRTTPPAAGNLLCQEASGVAYDWDTDSLVIVGDGGKSITRVSKTGVLLDAMTLPAGGSPQSTEFYDPEGVTYVGGGQFVFSEERDRRLVKFTYAAGTTLTRAATQGVKIGTFNDNEGTEGLCYDRQNGGFIVLKETNPIGVFATDLDFAAGTATNGSASTANSTNLFDPALLSMSDVADVFTMPDRRLLILSQENARIANVSRTGVISSTLNITSDPGNPLSVANQQHEGITMDNNGVIYVVSENGGGDANHPQLWVYASSTAPNAAPTAVAAVNTTTTIAENTATASPIKVADLLVTDDGLGSNALSLTGADAASFEITGSSLYLKAGTVLDFETKASYAVTIQVDDTTVGSTPDATTPFTLTVTDVVNETPAGPPLIISEVAAWSSSTAIGKDWIELTNTTNAPITITGWKVDDDSNAFASGGFLSGVTTIAPGKSAVFFTETNATDFATKSTQFIDVWFGGTAPAGFQIGYIDISGLGLSSTADVVNLYNPAGVLQSRVTFGASPGSGVRASFDNSAGLDATAISLLSAPGVYGAFVAVNDANQIGSPGTTGPVFISEVAAWGSGNSPAMSDWFEVTNRTARTLDISGWKINDAAASPVGANPLSGVSSIAPGESVIFLEGATPAKVSQFLDTWFGSNPPASLQIGAYSGPGLSTGGDAVHLYDGSNSLRANVFFGISDSTLPRQTFDNAGAINNDFITAFLSAPGVNGAFVAQNDPSEVGSPGGINNSSLSGFPAWLVANGYSSGGFDLDSDNDGLTDGQEYFFGLNPNDSSDAGSALQVLGGGNGLSLGFSLLNNATDASGVLQVSSNLLDWTAALQGIDYVQTAAVVNGDQTDYTYALPGSGHSAPGTSPDYLTPNTTPAAGVSLGGVRVVNHGLVGTGRLSGENLDQFGETQGAASGLFITDWAYHAGQFSGVFNVLPDRGFNRDTLFSNYAARLHRVNFTFTPYYGAAPVAQGQIVPSYASSTKFTYLDGATTKFTTGFNPTGPGSLFGQTVGVVTTANGPGGAQTPLLSFDAEAVYLFADGSGYVSDEYGTYIARFNPAKQITGITQLPAAARPFRPAGTPEFDSVNPPTTGRRNNQGLEGMSVTPDGTKLFALMQSALVQDTNGSQQQTRNNARLFVYDIAVRPDQVGSSNRENPVLIGEYVVKLPRFDSNGDGSALDRTAAQSEIVAVGDAAFLMLPRDGNGLGTGTATPTVLKSVRLVDFASASNILGTYDAATSAISPAGVLNPAIVPAASAEIINMLAPADLAKFGFNTNNAAANSSTINEKWEGMSLVPDISTPEGNDFFLFVANDNDFQSSNVKMLDGSGAVVSYGDGRLNAGITNDAMYFAYRVTIDTSKRFFRFDVSDQ